MFVAASRLLAKVRQPPSRKAELAALGARLREALAGTPDAEERDLAREVHARKLAVATELHAVTSCASCAKHQPAPVGTYPGGACCSGVTADLFDDSELAMLAATGTRVRDLVPPPHTDAHAGCAFRGSDGCSVDVAHRPARCVLYLCPTLRRELHAHGQLDALEGKLGDLESTMRRFIAAHEARRDRDTVVPIIEAIEAAVARRR